MNVNKYALLPAVAIAASLLLGGCGGGSSASSTIPTRVSPKPPPTPSVNPDTVEPFRVSIFIPNRYIATPTPTPAPSPAATDSASPSPAPTAAPASSSRKPQYLPLTVGSINFQQTLSGGASVNTSTLVVIGGFTCSNSSGGQTCYANLVGALGSDQWTVTTYVSNNGTGSPLSIGILSKTILSGVANTSSLTLNPILASMAFIPTNTSCNAAVVCSPSVTLAEYDANGSQILGPGSFVNSSNTATPITITNSNGSITLENSGGSAAATSITQVSDGTLSQFAYDGSQSAGSKTFTATATGVTTATFTLTLTTGTITTNTPIAVGNTNPTTANITASETGLVGSFTSTPSGCTGIVTIGSVSNSGSPATFSVTQVGGGTCTTIIADGHGASTTVTINSTTYVVTLSDVIRQNEALSKLPTFEPGLSII